MQDSIGDMTVEEAVQHYGVAGMKWGKTRAKATGSEIREARRGIARTMDSHIKKSGAVEDKISYAGDAKGDAKLYRKLDKMDADYKKAYDKDPRRVVAARMTRGEKAIAVLLAGPTASASLGLIAGTSAVSRRIEYKQDVARGKKP